MREWLERAVAASVALIVYMPVAYGLKDAFLDEEGRLTFRNLYFVLSSPAIHHALSFTLVQSFISSSLATALGFLGAIALLTLNIRGAGLLRSLTIIPFMAPPMIVVSGFTFLYGSDGLLTKVIPQASILGNGFWGVIAAHVFYNIPLSLNLVYASIVSVPKEIVEALNVFGRGRVRHLVTKIIVPYSLPALSSSFLLSFIYCFMSFAIPLNIGGVRYSTLEVYIYSYYKLMFDPGKAAGIALLQFLILSAVASVLMVLPARSIVTAPSGARHHSISLSGGLKAVMTAYLILLYLYLFTPLISVYIGALRNPYTGRIDLHGFQRIFNPAYDPALGTSVINVYANTAYYAFMSMVITVTIATLVTILGGTSLDVLFTSLLAVSPLTLSLGLTRTLSGLLPTPALIIFAHSVASLPLATRALRLGYIRIRRTVLDIPKLFGIKGLSLFVRVLQPLMMPSYLVASSLAIVISLGEFSATLFMAGPRAITLSVAIYLYRGVRDWQASGAAAATLLTVSAILLILLSKRIERWL